MNDQTKAVFVFRLRVDNYEEPNEYRPYYYSVMASTVDEAIDTLLAEKNAPYHETFGADYCRYKRSEINLATIFADHTREITFPMVM